MYYYDLESYTKSLFGSEAEYFFLWKLTAVHSPQHIRGFMQHLKASGNRRTKYLNLTMERRPQRGDETHQLRQPDRRETLQLRP